MVHILLAEDNPGDVLLIQEALSEHYIEHELHIVRDGGEALTFLSQMGRPGGPPCPDLVLMDLNLPKVEGAEVLGEFRKHAACARTPVIVVSSSDAQKDRARMAALGVTRYFRKPSDFNAFLKLGAMVQEVIDAEIE